MATKNKTSRKNRRLAMTKGMCRHCRHAKFDETWGEYKCKVHGIRIYDVGAVVSCDEYAKDGSES